MQTRNILDASGNVIGTIEFSDDTSADQINAALALYTYSVPTLTPQEIVQASIQRAIDFGAQLMLEFSAENVLKGITQAGQTVAVSNYLTNLLNYISSGSLVAAITELNILIADTSAVKAGLAPFITNSVLYTYLNKIQSFLNIPLTQNPGS